MRSYIAFLTNIQGSFAYMVLYFPNSITLTCSFKIFMRFTYKFYASSSYPRYKYSPRVWRRSCPSISRQGHLYMIWLIKLLQEFQWHNPLLDCQAFQLTSLNLHHFSCFPGIAVVNTSCLGLLTGHLQVLSTRGGAKYALLTPFWASK